MTLLAEQIREYAGVEETICEDKTSAFVQFILRHGYSADRLKSGLNSAYNKNGHAEDKALYLANGRTCNKSQFRAEARTIWAEKTGNHNDRKFDQALDNYLSHFNEVGFRI